MRIILRVKTRAHVNEVVKRLEADMSTGVAYDVFVTTSAHDNEANKSVVRLIANYFNVARNRVSIISGAKSRVKKVEIED